MAFRASNARILVTDAADERVVFDSDEGLFSATDFIEGQVTTPERVAINDDGDETPVDIDVGHPLASVNSAADVVVGAFKVTTDTPIGLAGLGWFNANGSYVHYCDSLGTLTQPTNWFLSSMAVYTFQCSGGSLSLNERVVLRARVSPNLTVTHTLLAVTFDYKLFCGRFV